VRSTSYGRVRSVSILTAPNGACVILGILRTSNEHFWIPVLATPSSTTLKLC